MTDITDVAIVQTKIAQARRDRNADAILLFIRASFENGNPLSDDAWKALEKLPLNGGAKPKKDGDGFTPRNKVGADLLERYDVLVGKYRKNDSLDTAQEKARSEVIKEFKEMEHCPKLSAINKILHRSDVKVNEVIQWRKKQRRPRRVP